MYSLAESVLVQCAHAGVAEWVVCPGARNIELLQLLATSRHTTVWTHFDERAAGFFAVGRLQAALAPVGVITTSGTAVAELLPAVVEAYYQRRPLLILSADRPHEFRGSGAPQVIEQSGIFGQYADTVDLVDKNALSDNILGTWQADRPLHINICLKKPIISTSCKELDLHPIQRAAEQAFRGSLADLAHTLRFAARDGLVLMIGGLESWEQAPALWLAQTLKAPVIADATSGIREQLSGLLLLDAESLLKTSPPPFILRLGDIPVTGLWRELETMPQTRVYSITRTGLSGLARTSQVIQGDLDSICRALGDINSVGDALRLRTLNNKRQALLEELRISLPNSEQALVHEFSNFAAHSGCIYLGNSMPIRYWNTFAQRVIPTSCVRANRGANGIDGQLATFLGLSACVKQSWALLGDLTALYDSNVLAMLPQLTKGLRVFGVVNNHGGGIFDTMYVDMPCSMRRLLVQPHSYSFQSIAEQWGLQYILIQTVEDFEQLESADGNILVELLPDPLQTEQFNRTLRQA